LQETTKASTIPHPSSASSGLIQYPDHTCCPETCLLIDPQSTIMTEVTGELSEIQEILLFGRSNLEETAEKSKIDSPY
jgi:hypothetical protein